jgi:hypothetical protein
MNGSRGHFPAAAVLFVLTTSACSDSDPLDSQGSGVSNGVSASNVSGGGSNGGTNGGETEGGGTEGGTDTASEPTTGGPAPTREACDHYLDCLAVVSPAELPAAQMGFGPDGTCWDGPPESIEQCIQACVSGWEALHDNNPDEPACYLCAEDGDCAAGEACFDGDCRPAGCGNGVVDDDEVCDGQLYCEPDCSGDGCNPLSHAGCDGGEQCFVFDGMDTQCLPPQDGLPGLHEPCVWTGGVDCAVGLVCAASGAGCDPQGPSDCCTPLCNVQAEPATCPPGTECVPVELSSPDNYIGFCIVP